MSPLAPRDICLIACPQSPRTVQARFRELLLARRLSARYAAHRVTCFCDRNSGGAADPRQSISMVHDVVLDGPRFGR